MREELVLVSGIARNLFWNEEGREKAGSPYTNKISCPVCHPPGYWSLQWITLADMAQYVIRF